MIKFYVIFCAQPAYLLGCKLGPLSVMNTLGMPSQAIMFFLMNLTTILALMRTYASTIVVVNMNASIAVKRIASFRTH